MESIADVRILLDGIIQLYPTMRDYLGPDAGIVHSKTFESAILKIQNDRADSLTLCEKKLVVNLKLSSIDGEPDAEAHFAETLLTKRKGGSEQYIDTRFIQPTSNICKRFFSTAGYAFNDYRRSLLPRHLEMQLYLKLDKKFWDEKTVSNIFNTVTVIE